MDAYRAYTGHSIASEDRRFNRYISSLRVEMEHAFAIHANSWQLFTKKSIIKLNWSPVAAYYLMAILLSNIQCCLRDNQISKRFQMAPPSVQKYLAEYKEVKRDSEELDKHIRIIQENEDCLVW